jgi:tRNA threonylcarbamoyladenosine biosynthesis protein TsaB
MNILGLDTSTDRVVCFVANDEGAIRHAIVEHHDRDLSTRLYSILDRLLAGAGIDLAQVDIFAAGIGPGSFTGVRIAVTTVRTLAQATGKRLVAVSTLDTLALTACELRGDAWDRNLCAILPSRRSEVYAACYRNGAIVVPPIAAAYAQAPSLIESAVLAGPASLISSVIEAARLDAPMEFVEVDALNPECFARLAAAEIDAGRYQDPLSLDPMYIALPAISRHKSAQIHS